LIEQKNIIIGGGLTGLSTAYHLKDDCTVLEKEERAGGLCRTVSERGFSFDYSGHLLHLSNDYTRMLVQELLGDNIARHQRRAYIEYMGCRIPFPFQANLSALPVHVNRECVMGAIEARCSRKIVGSQHSFEEWVLAHLGKGIAKHFFIPYNTKLYGTGLADMTSEWCELFVPKPDLEEIVDGALGVQKNAFGYNISFLYPRRGGIQVLADALVQKIRSIEYGWDARRILWKDRRVVSADGRKAAYENLISTMPLPELLCSLVPEPDELSGVRNLLKWRTVYCLNLGVKGNDPKPWHWAYFPEPQYLFYRVGFIHNFSPESVPQGCSAMYVEVAEDPGKPVEIDALFERAIEDLCAIGILDGADEILVRRYLPIPYAYVVYNHGRERALNTMQGFLNAHGIHTVGRYGEWKYSSMETSILDGRSIAEKISR
jgi:protoporphyrinogen oxidase